MGSGILIKSVMISAPIGIIHIFSAAEICNNCVTLGISVSHLAADIYMYKNIMGLKKRTDESVMRFNELSGEIKDLELQMTANSELQKQIANYVKTREICVEYRKSGYSKKFRAQHESEIMIHQTAKKHFDQLGLTKLPQVKLLREQYAELLAQKRKAYAEYKQAREEMKELYNVKSNVSQLLNIDERNDSPTLTKTR